ncbi:hypothetical protein OC835_007913, partial [Tilletia horrida]
PSGQLYDVLESVLAAFVPMFEATLAEALQPHGGVRKEFRNGNAQAYWVEESWDPPAPQEWELSLIATPQEPEEYLLANGESKWDSSEKRIFWAREHYWKENRKWVPIPVHKYESQPIQPISLKGRRLQVIVKMATIHLTPEKPEYEGGSWHVEGTMREKICATGILYFDQANIGPSELEFRGTISDEEANSEFAYEQNEHGSLAELYGFVNEEETSQTLSGVTTKAGLALCFPNGLQHRVSPFKLEDPTRPGYRKILAFFLCDPLQEIISTTRVSPQQFDWMEAYCADVMRTLPSHLPTEIRRMVVTEAAPNAVVSPRRGEGASRPRVRRMYEGYKAPAAADEEWEDMDVDENAEEGAGTDSAAGAAAGTEDGSAAAAGNEAARAEDERIHAELWKSSGMTLVEARAYRAGLMRERAAQNDHVEERNDRGFSFCEH